MAAALQNEMKDSMTVVATTTFVMLLALRNNANGKLLMPRRRGPGMLRIYALLNYLIVPCRLVIPSEDSRWEDHERLVTGFSLRLAVATQELRLDPCHSGLPGHRNRSQFRHLQRRGRAAAAPPALPAAGPPRRRVAAFSRNRNLPRLAISRRIHRSSKRESFLRPDGSCAQPALHPDRPRPSRAG